MTTAKPKPRCLFCGHKHLLNEPHHIVVDERTAVQTPMNEFRIMDTSPAPDNDVLAKKKFDKNSHMRAYQKEYRAAKKKGMTIDEYRQRQKP